MIAWKSLLIKEPIYWMRVLTSKAKRPSPQMSKDNIHVVSVFFPSTICLFIASHQKYLMKPSKMTCNTSTGVSEWGSRPEWIVSTAGKKKSTHGPEICQTGLLMLQTLFLFLLSPTMCPPFLFYHSLHVFPYYHESGISIFDLLFYIDLFLLSFISLPTWGLYMVPIKGPAVLVPDDVIMASCVGTASCSALQCTCLGMFGWLNWYIRTPCIVVLPQNCSGQYPA